MSSITAFTARRENSLGGSARRIIAINWGSKMNQFNFALKAYNKGCGKNRISHQKPTAG
jgi:hypothetical protein